MQTSKTGGMGAGIGGSAAMNQAFGVEGADKLLVKITSVLAFIFMAIALSLVKISDFNTIADDGYFDEIGTSKTSMDADENSSESLPTSESSNEDDK